MHDFSLYLQVQYAISDKSAFILTKENMERFSLSAMLKNQLITEVTGQTYDQKKWHVTKEESR